MNRESQDHPTKLARIIGASVAVITLVVGSTTDGQEAKTINGQRAGVSVEELAKMSETEAGVKLIEGQGLRFHGEVIGVLEGTAEGKKRISIIRLRGTPRRYIQCFLPTFEPKAESMMKRTAIIEGDVEGLSDAIGIDGPVTFLRISNCKVIEPELASLPEPVKPKLPTADEYKAMIRDPKRRTCSQVFCAFKRQVQNANITPMARTQDLTFDELVKRGGGAVGFGPAGRSYSIQWRAEGAIVPLRHWEELCGTTKAVPLKAHDRRFDQTFVDNLLNTWNEELFEIPYPCQDGVLYLIGSKSTAPIVGEVFQPRHAMFLLGEVGEGGGKVERVEKDAPVAQTLDKRLRGTSWRNTNNFVFYWDQQGRAWHYHVDNPRTKNPLKVTYTSDSTCEVVFINGARQTITFDLAKRTMTQVRPDGGTQATGVLISGAK